MALVPGGPDGPDLGPSAWWDKVPSKFAGWGENRFREAGFRAVPNCVVRRSAYIGPNVILMPSFVHVGAFVDPGTIVATWAPVGPWSQIGKHCHLSGSEEGRVGQACVRKGSSRWSTYPSKQRQLKNYKKK